MLPAAWEVAGDLEGTFTPATLAGPEAGTAVWAVEDEGVDGPPETVVMVWSRRCRSCLAAMSMVS